MVGCALFTTCSVIAVCLRPLYGSKSERQLQSNAGEVNMRAPIFPVLWGRQLLVVVVRWSTFNAALQTKNILCSLQRPSPSHYFHPSLRQMKQAAKISALNHQSVINGYYPRWMVFCKPALSSGLNDGKSGFGHFCLEKAPTGAFPSFISSCFQGVSFCLLEMKWVAMIFSIKFPPWLYGPVASSRPTDRG